MMINCVDTKTNTAIFGHGGINVRIPCRFYIELRGIKPPVGAGTRILDDNYEKIGNWEYTGEVIKIPFKTYDDVLDFSRMCNIVKSTKGDVRWVYKDINIDFSTYSEASMDVLESAIENIKYRWVRLMAC